MYSMRSDMRAPEFGAPATELYEAAIDMCERAETRGCAAAVICEHHGSLARGLRRGLPCPWS